MASKAMMGHPCCIQEDHDEFANVEAMADRTVEDFAPSKTGRMGEMTDLRNRL